MRSVLGGGKPSAHVGLPGQEADNGQHHIRAKQTYQGLSRAAKIDLHCATSALALLFAGCRTSAVALIEIALSRAGLRNPCDYLRHTGQAFPKTPQAANLSN